MSLAAPHSRSITFTDSMIPISSKLHISSVTSCTWGDLQRGAANWASVGSHSNAGRPSWSGQVTRLPDPLMSQPRRYCHKGCPIIWQTCHFKFISVMAVSRPVVSPMAQARREGKGEGVRQRSSKRKSRRRRGRASSLRGKEAHYSSSAPLKNQLRAAATLQLA